ncbi:MAG: AbgT family transporter [Thermoanaerobaculia bacterium]|nr:AbgT family transporter [Thermoanaerobaculia bacterium]
MSPDDQKPEPAQAGPSLLTRIVDRSLLIVEKGGNALPHPGTLFALFAAAIVLISGLTSWLGIAAKHPSTGATISVVNLMTLEGLHRIMNEMVTNFTGFAPLGTVLVAMLGIGLAESTGLIGTGLRLLVLSAPPRLLTFTLVFAGVLSNAASEVGYVLLVPLGAVIFLSAGRHPLAGLAASFAGVSGGYSANLLIGTVDPLLAGLSQEAAHILDPDYSVTSVANYYFMFASTFFIAAAGTWVTEKIVEPRLGAYEGEAKAAKLEKLDGAEKRGLVWALVAAVIFVLFLVWGVVAGGFIQFDEAGNLDAHSPLLHGVVAVVFLGSTLIAIAYGLGAKTLRKEAEVIEGMGKALSTLGSYMVLVFFAAQFVAYFKWTNLGLISAIKGAEALMPIKDSPILLMIGFVIVTAFMNLFMGSASAKWSIMAPIFVPMFMLLGYSPEFTQTAYRIGDSVTNIISPMMSYFALIVAFVAKYQPKAGIGTVVATMLPYTVVFTIVWSALLAVWVLLGLPLGPGAGMSYSG